jgi:nitrile hydratase accessory protein
MLERRRNLVVRPDGRLVNVARPRGQLFVCATGCCCGRTDDGFAAVPTDLYHDEWERRRLRNLVHLTIGGCLGPCALANVVLLLFDGQALWFHSINSEALVRALYDHVEAMLETDGCLPLPPALEPCAFTASAWQPRPDGLPVDDFRPRRRAAGSGQPFDAVRDGGVNGSCLTTATLVSEDAAEARLHRLLVDLDGATTVPRRNGELVFEAPWQGRVFGMAVALSEQGLFPWEEFRQALIAEVAAAEARRGEFRYYDAWLAAFERVLTARGAVSAAEIEETAFQFEFGERDDVF